MVTRKPKAEGPKTMMFKQDDLEVIASLRDKYKLSGLTPVQIVRVILRRADTDGLKAA